VLPVNFLYFAPLRSVADDQKMKSILIPLGRSSKVRNNVCVFFSLANRPV